MDLRYYRAERPSRSVPRNKGEPQAGPASCQSDTASKGLEASGDGVDQPEPNTHEAVKGEANGGLPGAKSVAREDSEEMSARRQQAAHINPFRRMPVRPGTNAAIVDPDSELVIRAD